MNVKLPHTKSENFPVFQNDINGLRGISVLLVVLFHFDIGFFHGGFIGVDIFFVISGFLMTKIIFSSFIKDNFNYFEFVLRRALRIFPALFFLIFVLIIAGAFFLPPPDLNSLAEQALHAVSFNSNNFFASKQGYFTQGADDKWLLHTWSLSVEWQFYMLYPVLLWVGLILNKHILGNNDLRAFYAIYGLILLSSLAYCIVLDTQVSFFSLLTRAWQMMAGGLVYLIIKSKKVGLRYRSQISYLGIAVLAIAPFIVKKQNLQSFWPGYFALLPVIGACMVLYGNYQHNIFLKNKITQYLGTWSYSIYLWHWPLIISLGIAGLLQDNKLVKLIGIILSIFLGYLSHRYIESADLFKQRNLKLGNVFKILVPATILFFLSFTAIATDGLGFRVNDRALFQHLESAETAQTYKDGCENVGLGYDKLCILNSQAPGKKMLIIGDSHAGHLYPWFNANSKINTTFFIKSGCPAIQGFERVNQNKSCRAFTKKAYELAESGVYQTVLISQNWTGFSKTGNGICSVENDICVPLIDSANPLLSVERMKSSIENILIKGVEVAVLDATPFFNFLAPKEISRQMFWHGTLNNSYDQTELLDKNRDFDKLFAELTKNPKFHLISLRPQLCKDNKCSIFDEENKESIYKDKDHLNPKWLIKHGGVFAALEE